MVVTGHGPSVSQVSRQNFMHQPSDVEANETRQHPNDPMPASGRHPFQALQPSLLDSDKTARSGPSGTGCRQIVVIVEVRLLGRKAGRQ